MILPFTSQGPLGPSRLSATGTGLHPMNMTAPPSAAAAKLADRSSQARFPGLQQRQALLSLLQQQESPLHHAPPQPAPQPTRMSSKAAAMLTTINAMAGLSGAPGSGLGSATSMMMGADTSGNRLESFLSGMQADPTHGLMHMTPMDAPDPMAMQHAMRRASVDEAMRRMSVDEAMRRMSVDNDAMRRMSVESILLQNPAAMAGVQQRLSLESAGNRSSMESAQSTASIWHVPTHMDAAAVSNWAVLAASPNAAGSAYVRHANTLPSSAGHLPAGCTTFPMDPADVYARGDTVVPPPHAAGIIGDHAKAGHVPRSGSLPATAGMAFGATQRRSVSYRPRNGCT